MLYWLVRSIAEYLVSGLPAGTAAARVRENWVSLAYILHPFFHLRVNLSSTNFCASWAGGRRWSVRVRPHGCRLSIFPLLSGKSVQTVALARFVANLTDGS